MEYHTGKRAFRILVARAYGIRGFADPPYVARFAVAEMNTCKNAIAPLTGVPRASKSWACAHPAAMLFSH